MQVADILLHTTRGMEAQRRQYLSRYCQRTGTGKL